MRRFLTGLAITIVVAVPVFVILMLCGRALLTGI